jgi:hypothetical protein
MGKAGQSTFAGKIERAELEMLTAGRAAVVASRASGTFEARWPAMELAQLKLTANLKLTATQPGPEKNVLPVSGPLTVNYEPGRITASSKALQTLAATTDVRIIVQNGQRLEGTAKGRTANIDALLDGLNAFLGRAKPLVPVEVAGATQFNAVVGGTMERPEVDLDLESPSMQISKLKNAKLDADIQYSPERVVIENAVVRWLEQALVVQGTVAMEEKRSKLDLNARADGAAVAALITGLENLNLNLPLKGEGLAIQAHIGGTTEEPKVKVTQAEAPGALGDVVGRLLRRK